MSRRHEIGVRRRPRSAARGLRLGRLASLAGGALLLASPSLVFGDGAVRLSLADKVFQAESIVEVRLPLDQPIPKHAPSQTYDPQGRAFPRALFDRAMKDATIERVLKPLPGGTPPSLPKQIYVFAIQSPCWWKAHQKGSLRSLIFLKRDAKGRYEDSGGVEHEQGLYSDVNPDYGQLVKAIQDVTSWTQEAGPRALAAQHKILTASHDPYQLYLTVKFLYRHAPEVLDEAWGAGGTPTRTQYERMIVEPSLQGACAPASASERK